MQEGYLGKAVICDSSSLIALAESCLFGVVEMLGEKLPGGFFVSDRVKQECIDRPMRMRSHELTAVRLKDALNRNVIKLASAGSEKEMNDIVWVANNIFYVKGRPLSVIHAGEADMIATARIMGTNNILIDERTTRMLVEAPEKLRDQLEREFMRGIQVNENYLQKFEAMTKELVIVRSSELVMVAYERGYFKKYGTLEKKAIEAALYGLKFNGCGISFSEIDEFCNSIR
ncbi:MAG: hypothetical protein ABIF01_04020 [Candidatus Micrarchaeota archaeon]